MTSMTPPPGPGSASGSQTQPPSAPTASNPGLPMPAQAPPPGALMLINAVSAIVTNSRMIAEQVPAAVPIVQQINDLVQQLQMKIVQSMPPTEPAAPPV